MSSPSSDYILITDVGSTTTKALLITRENDEYRFVAEASVPTTVEKPFEDVKIGVREAIQGIEKSLDKTLLSESGKPLIPYVTTSSAGGGLQILVFGLTSGDTGRIAEMTAYGAGGVILNTFTIDDRIPAIHKMRMIRDVHPDMILLAGGIDGGDIANLVRLSEILSLARPTPKFDREGRNTLLFCGNTEAREFVKNVFDMGFAVHIVDNIRPNLSETNPEPAKRKIHELFMKNVMQRAPGYSGLTQWVSGDIIPTPSGVEKILRLYGERHDSNVVMVDMGGATTDIFSNIYGEYYRTVAANIGMSYSICNIISEAGMESIMAHLPEAYSEDAVRNYMSNKMIDPTYVPESTGERLVEEAAAIVGIGLAWNQHQDMNFKVARVGLLDRLKKRLDYDPFQETFYGQDVSSFFHVSDIDLIIGSGGVLSHGRSDEAILAILVESFKPIGITKIGIDSSFKSPHLGILSMKEKEIAVDLFEKYCLREIAYVVAPTGEMNPEKTVLSVRDKKNGVTHELKGDEVFYAPGGGDFEIFPARGVRIYQNMTEVGFRTDLPVLFDCRGRGKGFTGKTLSDCAVFSLSDQEILLDPGFHKPIPEIIKGEQRFVRELPYEGTIFVQPGDEVEADTVVGENTFTPPRLYMVDVQRLVGYQRKLSLEAIKEGILVEEGQEVRVGQRIFRGGESFLGLTYFCSSPVRGRVIKIEENGLIILREIQDHSRKPVEVKIAERLGIAPKHIKSRLEFDIGDFVQIGQNLVKGSGARLPIKAPRTGTLKEIDTIRGTVTLQYDLKPVPLKAFIKGRVEAVIENHSAEIVGKGAMVYGVIGFGAEISGEMCLRKVPRGLQEDLKGKIVVSFDSVDSDYLRSCAEADVAGLVVPSMNNRDWVEFSGEEIGVALTGDEKIPLSVIITEGFGEMGLNEAYRELFSTMEGRTLSLSPRTQIRAGVTRPAVFISDE